MTILANVYAAPAANVAASTVAFINANRGADAASTPFARSTLAAIVGGLSAPSMVESLIVAAFGSPVGKNGKPVAKVSALRDLDGGARLYQAWKAVAFIAENIDADAAAPHATPDGEVTVGDGSIRRLVTGFILSDDGAPSALFGATGIAAKVKDAMTAHNKAVAALYGVTAETPADAANDAAPADAAPVSLADRINTLSVALGSASDANILAVRDALSALGDAMDAAFAIIGDADIASQDADVAIAA